MTLKKSEFNLELTPFQKAMSARRFLQEEAGQDLIEYALIFTFVALAAIASLRSLTAGIMNVFAAVGTSLTNAT